MTYMPATASDFVSNATTASKESVTGVTVPAPASRVIEFEFRGSASVAATTTGVGFGIDLPAGATMEAVSEVTTGATGTDQVRTELLTADDTFAIPTDMSGTSFRWKVSGRVVVSTTEGSIQLRVDTDAAAAVTVKKGVTRWYQDCCAA